jgi:CheY-like chemotaxis protein
VTSPMLTGLQAKFMARMAAALRHCQETCAAGLDSGDASSVAAALHALAGEAAALGLEDLAGTASRGEQAALDWRDDQAARPACVEAVAALGAAAQRLATPAMGVDASPAESSAGSGGRRVLVVDDSALSAEAICDALDDAGLEARLALDLPAALAAVTEFQPAVILTDVQMPGLDASAVCRALRGAAAGAALRLVLMSGATEEELAEALGRTGADAGVSKHDGTEAIVRVVSGVMA